MKFADCPRWRPKITVFRAADMAQKTKKGGYFIPAFEIAARLI
jgi:hypothetical protein